MNDATILKHEIHADFSKEIANLRTVNGQIRSLIRDSAVKLNNSFTGLLQQAEQQQELVIELASDLDEQATAQDAKSGKSKKPDTVNIQEFVKATDEILRTFVDRITLISQESIRMVYRMDDVAEKILRVKELLSKINTVVELTRGLALNARIVAARAGQSGESFNFVASEIHQLASSSRQVSDQIHMAVEETNANICSVRDVVKEMASKDMGFAMDAKSQVSDMISDISEINTFRAKTLRQVFAITEGIGENVEVAISLLGFENAVTQVLKRVDSKLAVFERFSSVVDWESLMNDALSPQERLLKVQKCLVQQKQAFDAAGS